jgi:hypothetical protein
MPSTQSPVDELLEGGDSTPTTERRMRAWLAATLVGVLAAGGLIYSLKSLNSHKTPSAPAVSTPRDAVDNNRSVQILKPKDDDDPRPKVECTVIGYVPDDEGGLSGLVLATRDGDKLRFAGVVPIGVSEWQSKSARDRLMRLAIKDPAVEGLDIQAVWIQPVLICIVHHSGRTSAGQIKDPALAELLANPNDG